MKTPDERRCEADHSVEKNETPRLFMRGASGCLDGWKLSAASNQLSALKTKKPSSQAES
jgi:hypothetical protein